MNTSPPVTTTDLLMIVDSYRRSVELTGRYISTCVMLDPPTPAPSGDTMTTKIGPLTATDRLFAIECSPSPLASTIAFYTAVAFKQHPHTPDLSAYIPHVVNGAQRRTQTSSSSVRQNTI